MLWRVAWMVLNGVTRYKRMVRWERPSAAAILDANDRGIQSLAGLEHATALQELTLRPNEITDVSPARRFLCTLSSVVLGKSNLLWIALRKSRSARQSAKRS